MCIWQEPLILTRANNRPSDIRRRVISKIRAMFPTSLPTREDHEFYPALYCRSFYTFEGPLARGASCSDNIAMLTRQGPAFRGLL